MLEKYHKVSAYFQLEMSLPSFLCSSASSPLNWPSTIHCRLPSPATTALQVRTTSSLGRSTEPGRTPKTTGGPRGWVEVVVVVVVVEVVVSITMTSMTSEATSPISSTLAMHWAVRRPAPASSLQQNQVDFVCVLFMLCCI